MHLRGPGQVLREQIYALHKTEDFLFRPVSKELRSDDTRFQSSAIHTAHSHEVYRSVRQRVFSCTDTKVYWNIIPLSLDHLFVFCNSFPTIQLQL